MKKLTDYSSYGSNYFGSSLWDKEKMIVYSLILTIVCILSAQDAFSQIVLQEKRIYLVDVTASMTGKGVVKTPDIFNKVKNELKFAIESIRNPDTEITIIPFTNTPHNIIQGSMMKKDSLLIGIENLSIKKGDTNIADAWSRGLQEIDSTRINYIFMLTDGLHNCGPEKEILYERLGEWQHIANNKYYFAFYVMLTPNAKEQEICRIVDSTNQMWLIESTNVNATFIKSNLNIQANIKDQKTVKLPFVISNPNATMDELDFDLQLNENPYYKITNIRPTFDKGYVLFDIIELKPLIDLPIEVQSKLSITYNKEKNYMTFFTPEIINFKIINRGIREMTIKEKIQ